MSKHSTLILVSSGESIWDEEKKITGWTDVPLSELGVNQCKEAAYLIGSRKIDVAFTSFLKRGIHTTCIILDEIDQNCVKIKKHWRLNPRHFGAVQGLLRSEAEKAENYEEIRRGLNLKFAKMSDADEANPSYDLRYSLVPTKALPSSESLLDTQARVVPYWFDKIAPCLLKGKTVLVVSHNNTIRALRHFWGDYEDDISKLEVAACVPRVYEFNEKLEILTKTDLGNAEDIARRITRIV
jgi:2,3-bisphosphoglycerate-dependent phosphoglycerate mutase